MCFTIHAEHMLASQTMIVVCVCLCMCVCFAGPVLVFCCAERNVFTSISR